MTIHLHWFLPTGGDSRDVLATCPEVHRRDPTLDHLALVARTAEQLGFEAVLTPTGTWCEESWVSTAALIRLVRGGAGTALVGDHDEVAARIADYHELGFDEFILSGHPHLEEAVWVGEHVRPRLQRAGLVPPDPAPLASGEHRAVSAAR